jgi:hypothetical protein
VAAAATVSALARSSKLEEGPAVTVTGAAVGGGRTCCEFVELSCSWWLEGFRFRPDAPSVGDEVDFLRFFATGSEKTGDC